MSVTLSLGNPVASHSGNATNSSETKGVKRSRPSDSENDKLPRVPTGAKRLSKRYYEEVDYCVTQKLMEQKALVQYLFSNYVRIDDWFACAYVCKNWKSALSPLIGPKVNLHLYLDTSSSMSKSAKDKKTSFQIAKDAIHLLGSQCFSTIGKLQLHNFTNVLGKSEVIQNVAGLSTSLGALECRGDTGYNFLEAILIDAVARSENNASFWKVCLISDMEIGENEFRQFLTQIKAIDVIANLQLVLINVGPTRHPAVKAIFDQEKEKGNQSFITWKNFPPDPPLPPKHIHPRDEAIHRIDANKSRRHRQR